MTIEQENFTNRTKLYLICGVILIAVFTTSWSISKKILSKDECMVSITTLEMMQKGN